MIKGMGIDIIEIGRIAKMVDSDTGFIEKVFSPAEIAYCETKHYKAQHYAARFTAKEAFFKALGTGWRDGMTWQEIGVESDDLGKPRIEVTGKTLEKFTQKGMASIHLSLTHTHEYAAAVVVIE
jgi:holo-[acyl-carrier protein] synthase